KVLPCRLRVEHLSVGFEEAHLLAVGERLDPDPVRLLGARIPDRDLRERQRQLLLDDAALLAGLGVALGVALHPIDALDDHAIASEHFDDAAPPALVTARQHDDVVALTNLFHLKAPRERAR